MKPKHRCMARNPNDTARCTRPATKMMPTKGAAVYVPDINDMEARPASVATLRLCGICDRRLRSGSRSLYLELDDTSQHAAWTVYGSDTVWTQRRGRG